MQNLGAFLVTFISLYKMVLIFAIVATWLPAASRYDQPWSTLYAVTEPAMAPFRQIIPSIGGLDLSPIILFVLLNVLQSIVASVFGVGAAPISF